MIPVYSSEGMKDIERAATLRGDSYYAMMERAGAAVAAYCEGLGAEHTLIVCGGGNNGGDGYVAAEQMRRSGKKVAVLAVKPPRTEECKRAKAAYLGDFASEIEGEPYDLIVECISGTGFSGEPEERTQRALSKINDFSGKVVSVDLPAGVSADSGRAAVNAVHADITLAIQGAKFGHFLEDGADHCGKIVTLDIGIGGEPQAVLITERSAQNVFPPLKRNCNKGSFGRAGILAGSEKYSGAAVLSSSGAAAVGAGYTSLFTTEKIADLCRGSHPEILVTALGKNKISCGEKRLLSALSGLSAVAVGMGMTVCTSTYRAVSSLLRRFEGTLILDADALNSLARYGLEPLKSAAGEVVITPHPAEFARLTGKRMTEILSDPLGAVKAFSGEYGCTVLLKGATTLVCKGEECYLSASGTAGMAKAGSGDVLSGALCGLFARRALLPELSTAFLAAAGSFLVGKAGERAVKSVNPYSMQPTDTLRFLPKVVEDLSALAEETAR